MATNDFPMLFVPPHPPVPMPDDGPLVIGRSSCCGLRLPGGDASRRHAEIVRNGGGYLLRDLGSTNGTCVNGQAVVEHELRPGDRIQIAGNEITFCQIVVEPAVLDPSASDVRTIVEDLPAAVEIFRGELAEIPTFAVLQMLEMGRKTGALQVDGDEGAGLLWLEDGYPVHAETKSQKGFDAAISLVNANSGRFSFDPGARSKERSIEAGITDLLLEAARVLDETPN